MWSGEKAKSFAMQPTAVAPAIQEPATEPAEIGAGGSALITVFSGKWSSIGRIRPAFHGRSEPKKASITEPTAPKLPEAEPLPIPMIAGSVPE